MTTTIPFINLRLHSAFSINQSTLKIEDIIDLSIDDQQACASMTDCDTMFGAIRFYNAARAAGLKPILGVDILCSHKGLPSIRLLLIAKNYEGYLSLIKVISHKKLLDSDNNLAIDITNLPKDHVYCLTGSHDSLGCYLAKPEYQSLCEEWIYKLKLIFETRLFLEIQRPGKVDDEVIVKAVDQAAQKFGIPLVATHPTFFPKQSDFFSHEVRVCDKNGQVIHDRNRPRKYTPYQHYLTQKDASNLFQDFPDAIANTIEIAKSINIVIPLGQSVLPNFETQNSQPIHIALRNISQTGLNKHLSNFLPPLNPEEIAIYQNRLDMELDIIHSMGFDGYFMIVQDFISWAKNNDIPVGPGRGSGAGSLVAYSLGITDLDPIKFSLLFERFLNPERVSMPDFDIDFCKDKRERVISYVTEKYGAASVSGISNINTLQARAAIKAAGRALGLRMPLVDSVSKLVPAMPGKDVSIQSAINDDPIFAQRVANEPEVAKLIHAAQSLEGLPTAIGQHAAGIVISPTVISDYSPLYQPEGKAQAVTQYDKDDIEKAGLVKFDFLGLKTLTEIKLAVDFVRKTEGYQSFSIETIPLDDKDVFNLFQQGDTHCIFQFESPGMQRLLIDAKPTAFGDLVALNALYRPGPMDLIPEYIKRKNGFQAVSYLDERLEPLLGETCGIMVYQEQVMQIAQVIGGYSLGGADLLRRAMGKKKPEEMAKHRKIFIEGAEKKKVSAENAGFLYDLMEKFAGYGFNKSHAAAYTLLAYQTAYLKRHHAASFFAAWLSIESEEDTSVIPSLIKDARKHGIKILPPCVNTSGPSFTIESETSLRYGLMGLKGIGSDFINSLILERNQNGLFQSPVDFCERMKLFINKKYLETLTKSGSFDSLISNRATLLNFLPCLLKYSKDKQKFSLKYSKWQESVQAGEKKKQPSEPELPSMMVIPELSLLEKLRHERDSFGFYFSAHPYTHYEQKFDQLKACEKLDRIATLPSDWDQHLIAGVVNDVRIIDTKSGKFLIAVISDGDTDIEVKAFSSVANKIMDWFKKDVFVLLAVHIREDRMRGGASIQISDAKNAIDAEILLTESLHIECSLHELRTLQEVSIKKPGTMPVYAWHRNGSTMIRSQQPYAFCEKSLDTIELLKTNFKNRVKSQFLQGKPSTLRHQ